MDVLKQRCVPAVRDIEKRRTLPLHVHISDWCSSVLSRNTLKRSRSFPLHAFSSHVDHSDQAPHTKRVFTTKEINENQSQQRDK